MRAAHAERGSYASCRGSDTLHSFNFAPLKCMPALSASGAFRCHERPHVSSPGIGEEISLACLGVGGDDAGRNIHTPVGYHMHRWRDLNLHQIFVSLGRRLGDSRAHSERASTHIHHASGKPIRNWKLRARKLHRRIPKKHASCRCIISNLHVRLKRTVKDWSKK